MGIREFWSPILVDPLITHALAFILGAVLVGWILLKLWKPRIEHAFRMKQSEKEIAFEHGRQRELLDQVAYESVVQRRMQHIIDGHRATIQLMESQRNELARRVIELASELGGPDRVEEEISREETVRTGLQVLASQQGGRVLPDLGVQPVEDQGERRPGGE